jgi:peptidoglycan biosynthesis protein MviN/MurJ (putative lipid II flippase)
VERRVAASVALTSVAQIATMTLGGVLAILVAAEFGSDARTDGFFAAYGVYAMVILLAQSVRVTVVPRLLESGPAGGELPAGSPDPRGSPSFDAFNRFFAAVLVSVALLGVVFGALGDPLASLLTADDEAQSTARTALAILWPAAGFHLFAALAAAMLGVLGDYVLAAVSYAVGGISSIVAFLALEGSLGIDSLPVAVLIGAGVTAAPLALALARAGWRPALADVRGSTRRAGVLGLSSPPMVLMQLMYLISIAFAARLEEGAVTVFSYAFFGLGLLIALVASSIPIVFAAPLAATWDRDPESLRPHVDAVFRTGLMVLVPAVAAAALVGDDAGRVLLAEFTDGEVEQTVRTFLVLSGSAIVAEALAIPVTALFTLGRYGSMALLSLPVLGAYAALSAIASTADSLYWLAAVMPACLLGFALGMLALLHGRNWAPVAGRLGWEVLRMAAPAVPFVIAAAAFSGISDWVAYAVGLAGYAASIAAYMPTHRALALRLVSSIRASAVAGRA